jgi:hypothetical protein
VRVRDGRAGRCHIAARPVSLRQTSPGHVITLLNSQRQVICVWPGRGMGDADAEVNAGADGGGER